MFSSKTFVFIRLWFYLPNADVVTRPTMIRTMSSLAKLEKGRGASYWLGLYEPTGLSHISSRKKSDDAKDFFFPLLRHIPFPYSDRCGGIYYIYLNFKKYLERHVTYTSSKYSCALTLINNRALAIQICSSR